MAKKPKKAGGVMPLRMARIEGKTGSAAGEVVPMGPMGIGQGSVVNRKSVKGSKLARGKR